MFKLYILLRRSVSALSIMLFVGIISTFAQTSAFTYQGRFTDTSVQQPTNGIYTMTFRLYDAATNGNQIPNSSTAVTAMVSVVNNIFTTQLDFGAAAFNTTGARFLEIQVGQTFLTPRQEITSTPFSQRTLNAASADALSSACVGCVTNAQINSVAGSKVTGTVASATTATTATTAGNVSGVVAIANGGTGSSTKNFVDTTTAQTIGGNKTFSNVVTANTLSAGSGGVAMNDNFLRLRGSSDNNHGMLYSATIDGTEFRGNIGFRWMTGTSGATQRMSLNDSGTLTVNGNITSTGTINGTLANNSVGTAQVVDGSLRVGDLAVITQTLGLGPFTVGAHGCVGFSLTGGGVVGDLLTVYLANNTPAGFYVQPSIYTTAGSAVVNVCNTLNANNIFPAQNVRVVVMRP